MTIHTHFNAFSPGCPSLTRHCGFKRDSRDSYQRTKRTGFCHAVLPFKELTLNESEANKKINIMFKQMRENIHGARGQHDSCPSRRRFLTLSSVQKRRKGVSIQLGCKRRIFIEAVFDNMRNKIVPSEIKFERGQLVLPLKELRKINYSNSIVSRVTSYFYTSFCKKRYGNQNAKLALDPQYMSQVAMDTVVLPTFFNRKLAVCPPLPQEAAQILENLYITNMDNPIPEEVKTLLLNQGYLTLPGVVHRAVVLVDCISRRLLGAIHFTIRSDPMHCRVKSLVVDPKARGKKYGSLLLSYALQTAKEKRCSSASLQSSEEAIDFYLKFGFMVNSSLINSSDDWTSLSFEEQESLIIDHDNELLLEFFDDGVDARLEEMLEEARSS